MPQVIVPLIAAAGVPGLVTTAGGLTTFGTIVGSGFGLALSIGASLLFRQRPVTPKPQDVKNVIRNSVEPRKRHYGRARVGGSMVFIESKDGDLYEVIALGEGPFSAITNWFIDDTLVTRDPDGWVSDPDRYDAQYIQVWSVLGTEDQPAFAEMVSAFPGKWTTNHKLRGVAAVMAKLNGVSQTDLAKVYPNGYRTAINVEAETTKVYDPRNATTAFSRNLALCLRDYCTSDDGARIQPALIDEASFAVAANICDEVVPTKAGGTVERYHGALSYSFDEPPADTLERFLQAMDGRLYLTPEGKVGLDAGKWVAPEVHIRDEHILSADFTDGAGPFRSANEIIVKYTQVESDYSEATADPWRNEASISELGEVRSKTLEAFEIQNHNHARRIAKIAAHRANPRRVGTIRTTLFGMEAFKRSWIRITCEDHDIDGETFEITEDGVSLDPETMTVTMRVRSFGAAAYDFDPIADEGTAPKAKAAKTVQQVPQVPDGSVALTSRLITIGEETVTGSPAATQIRAYVLRVNFPPPPKPNLSASVQYRDLAEPSDWMAIGWDRESPGVVTSGVVERGHEYQARVQYRSIGKQSAWENSNTVLIPAASA